MGPRRLGALGGCVVPSRPVVRTFRFAPPIPARPIVPRPRLSAILDRRFEARVVTVVAGAGFGKSTLVGAALRANALSPRGDDCWLGCEPDDADAAHLAGDLWSALHGADEPPPLLRDGGDPARAIAEAVWARSPRQVALVLDDVHDVPAESDGARLLAELAQALPGNGHLVLLSRADPPIALSRARAHGAVVDLREHDLAFTTDELADFAALRGAPAEQLAGVGGWPALAELSASAHRDAVDGFLFEEVLARRDPLAVEMIEALAILGRGDHRLLGAVLGRPVEATDLTRSLGDVPLASRDAAGWWTLHPLWTTAVEERLDPARRRTTIRTAAGALRRTDAALAVGLLLTDGGVDRDGTGSDELVWALRSLLATPWATVTNESLLRLHRRLPATVAAAPEGRLLLAAATATTAPVAAQAALRAVAEHAESTGDHDLGLLAVERLVVIAHRRQDVAGVIDAFTRAHRLADHDRDRAAALVVLGDALLAEAGGDAARVLDLIDELRPGRLDDYWRAPVAWMRAQALLALGHPEAALAHSTVAVETAPLALRGEVGMLHVNVLAHSGRIDAALEAIPATIELLDDYGSIEARAMAHGQAAQRYAMGGLLEPARRHLDLSRDLAGPDPVAPVRANFAAAEAILAVAELDEVRARDVIAAALRDHPLGVGRQQYHERRRLALSYVLLPETRAFWDGEALGPVFVLTRASARALVALREDGDVRPAAKLEAAHWADVPATMPLPWSVELALAGSSEGSDDARLALKALGPDAAPILKGIAARTSVKAVARRATAVLASMPSVPSHALRIDALGPLAVHLDDGPVDDPNWRRERVRSLLAFLVGRRRVTREEATAALWPDLDTTAADRNLRVTLSYLHAVLEPGRPAGSPPYFVRTDGGQLVLADSEHLTIDVDEFARAVAGAEQERRHGSPAVELEHLLAAVAAYRGPFLADLGPEEWVLDERDRLRARFVGAAVRAGELALAGGEVDRARELADRAIAQERWSEPARRLLVATHLERRDRAAARRALDACLAMLDDLGVDPEPETLILARRLGPA